MISKAALRRDGNFNQSRKLTDGNKSISEGIHKNNPDNQGNMFIEC